MDSKTERKESVKWFHSLADFANLLKAFVGTNYLSLAYGFKEAGIGFGLAGLLLIAVMTDHCCCLIVKCKYAAINSLCRKYENDAGSDGNISAIKRRLYKDIRYPDIGFIVWGKWGKVAINFFLVITQIGFCTNYYIFVGNVLHTLIVTQENLTEINVVFSNESSELFDLSGAIALPRHSRTLDSDSIPFLHQMDVSRWKRSNNKKSENEIISLNTSTNSKTYTESDSSSFTQTSMLSTSATSTVSQEIANSKDQTNGNFQAQDGVLANNVGTPSALVGSDRAEDDSLAIIESDMPVTELQTSITTSSAVSETTPPTVASVTPVTMVTTSNMVSTDTSTEPVTMVTTASSPMTTVEPTASIQNSTKKPGIETTPGPALALLVMSPLPLFIIFTLYRDVRKMGPISMVANGAVVIGSCSVIFYIILDLKEPADIVWYKWATLPVYLGQVNSCYEAIGTIVSIEGSMKGNRHMYMSCLHGVMGVFSLTLCATAFIGYLRYGEDTKQILIQNLPQNSPLLMAVNVLLVIGVLGTYPLQVFPVIQIMEGYLFAEGAICGPKITKRIDGRLLDDEDSTSSSEDEEAQKSLLMSDDDDTQDTNTLTMSFSGAVSDKVSTWKRNLFRAFVAIFICGLAVLLRNAIAYVSALIGSIGSCPLAFIIPCLLHIQLTQSGILVKAKDIIIIIIGVVIMVISTVVTIQELAGMDHLEGLAR